MKLTKNKEQTVSKLKNLLHDKNWKSKTEKTKKTRANLF